jgi:hypothetical protein
MNDDRAQDALRLAEAALADALREGVTEAEALVMSEDSALTRFANSEIHQNVAETNVTINLRVVVGKRVGVASSGRTDAEGLRRLAENAAAIARVVEELEDWGGLPGRTGIRDVAGAYSRTTAEASPEFRAEAVRAVIGAADDAAVTAYGSFATGTESIAVANSAGARASGTRTTSQLITVSMGPDGGSGYAESAAVDASTIDAAALGREASGKARATANAISVDPGDYPVVLEEYAVVDLLDMLGYLGFSALAVQEERSFFEAGKRIGSDLVTIVDDGDDPAGLPLWFARDLLAFAPLWSLMGAKSHYADLLVALNGPAQQRLNSRPRFGSKIRCLVDAHVFHRSSLSIIAVEQDGASRFKCATSSVRPATRSALPLRIRAGENAAEHEQQRAPPETGMQLRKHGALRGRPEELPHSRAHDDGAVDEQ